MKPDLANDRLKHIALYIAGLVAMWCIFVIGWCTMWKIYIEIPVLFVLSNLVTGIVSCITTVLVGRTIAQLNQQSDVKNEPQIQQTATQEPMKD